MYEIENRNWAAEVKLKVKWLTVILKGIHFVDRNGYPSSSPHYMEIIGTLFALLLNWIQIHFCWWLSQSMTHLLLGRAPPDSPCLGGRSWWLAPLSRCSRMVTWSLRIGGVALCQRVGRPRAGMGVSCDQWLLLVDWACSAWSWKLQWATPRGCSRRPPSLSSTAITKYWNLIVNTYLRVRLVVALAQLPVIELLLELLQLLVEGHPFLLGVDHVGGLLQPTFRH